MFNFDHNFQDVDQFLKQWQINIQHLPDSLHNALQGKEGKMANEALRKLTILPGPPVYPIRWKSQKQRRAFFASNGFGRGIPSRRKGTLLLGWKVRYKRTSEGGVISLINDVPYMRYVQGDDAQPFHLDTGWVQREDVLNDFLKEAGDTVTAAWWTVSDAAVRIKA